MSLILEDEYINSLENQIKILKDQIKQLKETIKDLEWSGLEGCCPICDSSPLNGHDIGCKLWWVLNL